MALIGKVSVKVWPDTRTFRSELKAKLEAWKTWPDVDIPVEPDFKGFRGKVLREVEEFNRTTKAPGSRYRIRIRTEVDDWSWADTLREMQSRLEKAQGHTLRLTGRVTKVVNGLRRNPVINVTAKVNKVDDSLVRDHQVRMDEKQLKPLPKDPVLTRYVEALGVSRDLQKLERSRLQTLRDISLEARRTMDAQVGQRIQAAALEQEQMERDRQGKDRLRTWETLYHRLGGAIKQAGIESRKFANIDREHRERQRELRAEWESFRLLVQESGRSAEFAEGVRKRMRHAAIQTKMHRLELERLERTMARLREQREARGLPDWIDPKLDPNLRKLQAGEDRILWLRAKLSNAERDRQQMKRELRDFSVDADISIDKTSKLKYKAEITRMARDRFVTFIPRVSKTAAAKAATALAAIAGVRLAHDFGDKLLSPLKNIDKALPALGLITTGVATLGSYLGVAMANASGLIYSLLQIGPLAVTLPGIAVGMGLGVAALVVGLKDTLTYIPQLKTGMQQMGDAMSDAFWVKALPGLESFVNTALPVFEKGMTRVSSAVGTFTGELSAAFETTVLPHVGKMFDGLESSVKIFTGAAPDIARLTRDLGLLGASYMPRLAEWAKGVAGHWADFIEKAAKTGELDQWVEAGIDNLTALGSSIVHVTRMMIALGKAGVASGGATLRDFANGAKRAADIMNGEAFQRGLITFFDAARRGAKAFQRELGSAAETFSGLVRILDYALPAAGEGFGAIVGGFTAMFRDPEFILGTMGFFDGLRDGLVSLKPAMEQLGPGLGTLLEGIGDLARTAGPLLAVVLGGIGTLLDNLVPKIATAADNFVKGFMPLVEGALPVVQEVAKAFGDLIVALSEGVRDFISNHSEEFNRFFTALSEAIPPLAASVERVLGPALKVAGEALILIVNEASSLLEWFTNLSPAAQDFAVGLTAVLTAAALLGPKLMAVGQGLGLIGAGGFLGGKGGGKGGGLPILAGNLKGLARAFGVASVAVGIFAGAAWLGQKLTTPRLEVEEYTAALYDLAKGGREVDKAFQHDNPVKVWTDSINKYDPLKSPGSDRVVDDLASGMARRFGRTWGEKLNDAVLSPFNGLFGAYTPDVKIDRTLQEFDRQLAGMARNGGAKQAEQAYARLYRSMRNAGASHEEAVGYFREYESVLGGLPDVAYITGEAAATMGKKMKAIGTFIGPPAKAAAAGLDGVVHGLTRTGTALAGTLALAAKPVALPATGSLGTVLAEDARAGVEGIRKAFVGVDLVSVGLAAGRSGVSSVANGIVNGLSGVVNATERISGGVTAGLAGVQASTGKAGTDAVEALSKSLGSGSLSVLNTSSGLKDAVNTGLSGLYGRGAAHGQDAVTGLTAALSNGRGGAQGGGTGLRNAVNTGLSGLYGRGAAHGRDATNGLTAALRAGTSGAQGGGAGLKNAVNAGLTGLYGRGAAHGRDAADGLRNGITSRSGLVSAALAGLTGVVVGSMGRVSLYGAGAAIGQSLANGISSRVGVIRSVLSGITAMIPRVKGPMSHDKVMLRPAGRAIMDGLLEGLEDGFGGVRNYLRDVTAEISGTTVNAPRVNTARVAGNLDTGESSGGLESGRVVIHQTNYNPVREAPSVATNKALQVAGALGGLG